MKLFLSAIFCVLSFCLDTTFAKGPPVPTDFAYGLPVEADAGGALYQVPLPLAFYQGVTRSDLGDMCVFNGQGEIVPYVIRQPAAEAGPNPPAGVALPFFPIYGDPDQKAEGISLQIRRDSNGTLIDMSSSDINSRHQKVVAYLLDASSLRRPFDALELHWQDSPEGFVEKVMLESSNDLEHWTILSSGTTIANLRYGDHSLVQRRIAFAPSKARYLRLSWGSGDKEVKIAGATVEIVEEGMEVPRQWVTLNAAVKQDRSGEYYFDAKGLMPVDRLRVKLPQKNTLVSASLFSRKDENNEWRQRITTLVYNLHVGAGDIVSSDVVITPSRGSNRYWMMRVDLSGGGLGQGMPQLELGWIPQQLLFVARGDGPFTLAYGSARLESPNPQGGDQLTRLADEQKGKTLVKPARTTNQIVLGGEAMLQPASPPLPWKQWILWSVLIIGVLLLGWMSVRLYRQLGSAG